jgi:hypothetical protein
MDVFRVKTAILAVTALIAPRRSMVKKIAVEKRGGAGHREARVLRFRKK